MSSKYLQMDNRICLERQNKRKDQVTELILDHCQASRLNGLTEEFINLEALSIINVGLETLEGFPKLPKLRKLELCDNKITGSLNSLMGCPNIRDLNLAGNNLNDLTALEPLKNFQVLSNLDVFNCEISKTTNYRQKVLDLLPNIKKLDGLDRNQQSLIDSERSEDEDIVEETKMDYKSDEIPIQDSESMDLDVRSSSRVEKIPDENQKTIPQTVSTNDEQQTVSNEMICSPKKVSTATPVASEAKALDKISNNTIMATEQVTTIEAVAGESSVNINSVVNETIAQKVGERESSELENLKTLRDEGIEEAAIVHVDQDAVDSAPVIQAVEDQSNISESNITRNNETFDANVDATVVENPELIKEQEELVPAVQVVNNESSTIADLVPMQAAPIKDDNADGVEPDSAGDEANNWQQNETHPDESELRTLNNSADQDSDDSRNGEIKIHSSRERSEDEEDEDDDEEGVNDIDAEEEDIDDANDDEEQDDEDESNDIEHYNVVDEEDVDEHGDVSGLNASYSGYSSVDELEEGEYLDDEDEEEVGEDEDESINRTVELVESDEDEEESKEE